MSSEIEIKNTVESLLYSLKLNDFFPMPVEKIVRYIGYECHYFLPDNDVKDIETASCHIEKKIYVNQEILLEQQRFSIAQKIGHILLHGDHQDYIDNISALPKAKEREAELFAEHLLLPEAAVFEQWIKNMGDADKISEYFQVSTTLVNKRVESLGLSFLKV